MVKALVVGLSLVLGIGVASAQPKKAPRKRPAPAKKLPPEAAAPLQPDAPAAPTPASPEPRAPSGVNDTLAPASRPPAPGAQPGAPGRPGAAGPMKTDEKVDRDEKLRPGDYRRVSPENERTANNHFREGNENFNDSFFKKAAEKYRAALSFWDHPAIHYNLALALINLDQPIEVYEELNKALQYGPDPLGKDKFDRAKENLRLVEGQLADIEVSCNQPGAKISVDNKQVFVAPGKYTAKVRVGKHTFFGDKEGYNQRAETPFVGPGEKFRIELKVYTDPELTRFRRRWPTKAWLPYTVLGAGAAFGITGVLMQRSAQSSYDEFSARVKQCQDEQPDGSACTIDRARELGIEAERDSGDSKKLMGYIGFGAAGAAVATGAVLTWMNRRTPYRITPEQLERDQGKVSVAPIVSPGSVGAMVQGHF
jgi:tetratricopeptide (TPR) repeat protein